MHRSSPRTRRQGLAQTLSNFLKQAKAGLLGVLAISRVDGSTSWTASWLPWIGLLLRTWQLLSFVTDESLGLPWTSAMTPVEVGGSYTNVRAYSGLASTAVFFNVAYYCALAWVFVLSSLLAWGVYNFSQNSVPFLLPLHVMRVMANFSTGVLFIPLLQLLLAPPACVVSCDAASDATRQAVGITLAALLILLGLVFAGTFYISDSHSRNADASAHGRVNVLMLLVKLVAVIVGGRIVPGLSVTLVGSTLLVAGVAWLAAYLYYMPNYRHAMNAANVGAALVFLWSLECLVLNNAYRATDASLTFWVNAPFVFLTGVYLASLRAGFAVSRPSAQLSSPFAVELQNRYLLHQALWGHPLTHMPDSPGAGGQGHAALAALLAQDASSAADVLSRAAALRAAVPAEVIERVLASYRSAAARFPDSAIIHVFIARFYLEWLGNKHMTLSHLAQAERRAPGIDIAYVIFAARRSDEADGGRGSHRESGGSLTAINRVAFEKATQVG